MKLAKKIGKEVGMFTKYGVEGYNKPKRTPDHPTKSHMVLANEGSQVKLLRCGQQGV